LPERRKKQSDWIGSPSPRPGWAEGWERGSGGEGIYNYDPIFFGGEV
jgi:hypothetical protein